MFTSIKRFQYTCTRLPQNYRAVWRLTGAQHLVDFLHVPGANRTFKVEAVGISTETFIITIFVSLWNFGQFVKKKKSFVNYLLTVHNRQNWTREFLSRSCHEFYRVEAVGLKNYNYTWKIMFFVNMWNLGQFLEKLIFCQWLLN